MLDSIVGNMTSYAYGSSTRLYAKRTDAGPLAVAREFLSASLQQTYSTDARAIANDQSYRDTNRSVPSHFSPVRIDVRASPKQEMNVTFQTQFDGRWHKFQTYAAITSWNTERVTLAASWNQVHFRADEFGNNTESALSHYLNTNTTLRFKQNRYGIVHCSTGTSGAGTILQQRHGGLLQCAVLRLHGGVADVRLYQLGSSALVPQDRRFHFSVTLAGIGNVSNIFGALGGTPNR